MPDIYYKYEWSVGPNRHHAEVLDSSGEVQTHVASTRYRDVLKELRGQTTKPQKKSLARLMKFREAGVVDEDGKVQTGLYRP